jgi:hypothetical protein
LSSFWLSKLIISIFPQAARKPLFGFKNIKISPDASPRHSLENELGKQRCLVSTAFHLLPTLRCLLSPVAYTTVLKIILLSAAIVKLDDPAKIADTDKMLTSV